jgi:hypothetical protein
VYAGEADVLNMALCGKTAKEWRDDNPKEKGNVGDCSNVSQLVCLSNLESLNAILVEEKNQHAKRLEKLNQVAIRQMKILLCDNSIEKLQ